MDRRWHATADVRAAFAAGEIGFCCDFVALSVRYVLRHGFVSSLGMTAI
jgi:hypothetical protein